MPTEIYLVKVGMTMTEGTVEEWYAADGATVAEGDLLYRLETEKINLDVDAGSAGTVKHLVAEGTVLEPGDVVGFIFAAGESIPAELPAPGAKAPPTDAAAANAGVDEAPPQALAPAPASGRVKSSPAARRLAAELSIDLGTLQGSGPQGRIVEEDVRGASAAGANAPPRRSTRVASSPVARKRAAELDVDLALVNGTGPGGRITKEDVEQAASQQSSAPAPSPASAVGAASSGTDAGPLRGIRKTIADRMLASLQTSAQLTIDMEVGMEDAVKLRAQLNTEWAGADVRITYTDLIVVAATKALSSHPMMNSALVDGRIQQHAVVHMGVAVALAQGLVVPVIRDAQQRSLQAVAVESARLAEAARSNALTLDDLQGGTFTVTSLGMYGVDTFTPILNAPQTGILGVGRIYDGVSWDGETPVKKPMLRLSLTWDHRVLDGAPAAEFLAKVKDYLEQPFRLLV